MKVLFVLLTVPRLEESSIYSDLVIEFINNNNDVSVVAPAIKKGDYGIRIDSGAKVVRVNTLPLFNVNPIIKGVANVLLPNIYIKAIKKYFNKESFDLVIIPTPTVMFARIAEFIKKKFKSKVYLILRDIFPQNAVDLDMIQKGSYMYNFFKKRELRLYETADKIGCTSQANIDFIIKNNPNCRNKLHILNNFSKKQEREVIDKKILLEYGIENKFVVVFGGNMGIPQKIENVLDLAKKSMEITDIVFLIIGKGTQTNYIKKLADKMNIKNIVFVNYIEREKYKMLISSCDVGLISLNERFTVPNTPYKLNDYFDCGLSVLASIDRGNDLGDIIECNNAGTYAYAGEGDDLFFKLKYLYENPSVRIDMGKNGQLFYDKNMTTEIAYNTICNNIKEIN